MDNIVKLFFAGSTMKKERKTLSMESLIACVSREFARVKDPSKYQSKYSIKDCLLSGLGMFYLKMESLLQFIGEAETNRVCHNLINLYGVSSVPSDTHFRIRLDDIEYRHRLQYAFDVLIRQVQRGKVLEDFHYFEDYYLVAVDGTGYFSSDKVHCENCCEKHHRDGHITYYHQVLSAVLVCPGIKEVLPLGIEPIIKQDGDTKNDCERNAAKRLLQTIRTSHPNLKIILVMDALYANGPLIELLQELDFRYIITGKNLDHMYDQFKYGGKTIDYKITTAGVEHKYKFANDLELNATCPNIHVNYVEYHEISRKKKFFNSWITDLKLGKDNIQRLVVSGRARWRIENETFNTLKNQGYHFEHNFGHGYNNLSVVLCHVMFIAFLMDQIQAYCGRYFKQARKLSHAKKYVWEKIRNTFLTVDVVSWKHLYLAVTKAYTMGWALAPPE